MDSPSSSPKPLGKPNIQRFIRRVISPAIVDKTCPICLRTIDVPGAAVLTVCFHAYCLDCIHKWSDLKRNCPLCNSTFDSWFYKIDLSSLRYLKQQLPAISDCKSVIPRPRSTVADRRRIIERTRREMNDVNRRTRPLPWRRSFGRPGTMLPHVIAERKLQWRASVYNRRLQAVPIYHGNGFQQNVPRIRNDFEKEKLLRRIEPWIQRELEAILGDPDPSIILHVVSSLLFSRHEGKHDGSSASSTQLSFVNDNFLAPLEPFLHDRTNMFWHELRSVPSELVILDGLVMAALSVVKPSVLSNCLKLRDPRSRGCGSRRISRAEQIKHVSRSCKQARCQPTNSCNSRQISRAD